MREFITELCRCYDVRFEVTNPAVYECLFSLQTPNLPLRELLDELENIAPIRCSLKEGIVVISGR